MNTEQMRAEFESWAAENCIGVFWGSSAYGYKCPTTEASWQAWQACCKKQEDRIAESTRELTDLLGGALVALEQREDAPPYPLFSTETDERLLAEIMELKAKLVSVTDEYLNAEADAAKLRQQLADKREFVVELPNAVTMWMWTKYEGVIREHDVIAAIEAAGGRVK